MKYSLTQLYSHEIRLIRFLHIYMFITANKTAQKRTCRNAGVVLRGGSSTGGRRRMRIPAPIQRRMYKLLSTAAGVTAPSPTAAVSVPAPAPGLSLDGRNSAVE